MAQFRDSDRPCRDHRRGWRATILKDKRIPRFRRELVRGFRLCRVCPTKRLPVLAQWYQAAPPDLGNPCCAVQQHYRALPCTRGQIQRTRTYGTYDMAGNVREWIVNTIGDLHFILGGSWKSQSYLYADPEALSPFDRSDTNGFRCVRNIGSLPAKASKPVQPLVRDFAKFKPVSDDVFRAYKLLYEYPHSPLNAQVEGVVEDTADWREEKITFDEGYGNGHG